MAYTEILSPNRYVGTGGFKKIIIVVHTSEPGPYSKGKNPGTAASLGNYLKNPSIQASYHIEVDAWGNVNRSLVNADRAWAAGGIANNEGYHICAVGWAAWSRDEWLAMPAMLDSMAVEIANWCRIEGIPAQFVASPDLPKNVWGITGHKNCAEAWRETSHTDPGNNFPYDVLISKVKAILNPAAAKSAIEEERDKNPWLGNKITVEKELPTADGLGRFAFYDGGAVYWSLATGAHAIAPAILQKYGDYKYESGFMGFPTSTVFDLPTGKGQAQGFQGTSVYWSKDSGAHTIGGAIGSKWAEMNWEESYLGFPVTDEITLPDLVGKLQVFRGGHIYYHPDSGAYPITGIIWDCFAKNNYENICGYPKTAEISLPNRNGKFQIFTAGHIYFDGNSGKAFLVSSDFMYYYERLGYENSRLGMPIENKVLVKDNLWNQRFENGSIQINRDTKEAIVKINDEVVSV